MISSATETMNARGGIPNAGTRGNFRVPKTPRKLSDAAPKKLSTEHRKAISKGLVAYHESKGKKNWISGAVKNPGALTRYAKRKGLMPKDGKLTDKVLNKIAQTGNSKTQRRAKLAKTLRNLGKRQ